MKIDNFFSELKRRNVYKVADRLRGRRLAAGPGWPTQVFPIFEIPNWALRLIVTRNHHWISNRARASPGRLSSTPEGIKRTEDVDLVTTNALRKSTLGFMSR